MCLLSAGTDFNPVEVAAFGDPYMITLNSCVGDGSKPSRLFDYAACPGRVWNPPLRILTDVPVFLILQHARSQGFFHQQQRCADAGGFPHLHKAGMLIKALGVGIVLGHVQTH